MTFRNPTDFADAGRTDPGLLLDALQKQAIERVVPALDRALGRVDDYLFDRSQSGNDNLGLTALRDLRRVRSQIAQRFEQALISGFRALRDPRAASAMLGEHSGLSLLSEDALEEQLANEQLAESMSRMHAPSLELLGKRIAHVLGRDELKATDNPLAPAFIAAAMRKAVEAAEVDPGVRIVVFKFFERELANALAHYAVGCRRRAAAVACHQQGRGDACSRAARRGGRRHRRVRSWPAGWRRRNARNAAKPRRPGHVRQHAGPAAGLARGDGTDGRAGWHRPGGHPGFE